MNDRIIELNSSARGKAKLLAGMLKEDILNQTLKKGDKIPSYDELSKVYGINRLTARKALKELEKSKLIYSIPAKGTYVGSPKVSREPKAQARNKTIGIISTLFSFEDLGYHHLDLIGALRQQASQLKYHIQLLSLSNSGPDSKEWQDFSDYDLFGLLVIGPMEDEQMSFLASHFSMIHIDSQRTINRVSCINIDNIQGGYLAGDLLIQKGHRDIAIIEGGQQCSADRITGFKRAIDASGVKVELQIYHGNFKSYTGYACAEEVLNNQKGASAIFCLNDEMAAGAIQKLTQSGVSIPKEVAVVGYDNSRIASLIEPSLTTIGISTLNMARAAIESLALSVETSDPMTSNTLVNPVLIERNSTRK
ncbi:MAG: GntR family transcriptional regulator [Planctomycetes bacterium]|nr:GntR family transcriptional regulator [Planctomycetota bacterium]